MTQSLQLIHTCYIIYCDADSCSCVPRSLYIKQLLSVPFIWVHISQPWRYCHKSYVYDVCTYVLLCMFLSRIVFQSSYRHALCCCLLFHSHLSMEYIAIKAQSNSHARQLRKMIWFIVLPYLVKHLQTDIIDGYRGQTSAKVKLSNVTYIIGHIGQFIFFSCIITLALELTMWIC